jgi:5-methylcytosine-specific restriction endonuclease McrA
VKAMRVSKKEREKIKNLFGGKCAYCGTELGEKYHLDHIKPIRRNWWEDTSISPENDVSENLYPACIPCNLNKGSLSPEDWRKKITHYRDVQLLRDSHVARHLNRFGIINFNPDDVVFYFEELANQDLM